MKILVELRSNVDLKDYKKGENIVFKKNNEIITGILPDGIQCIITEGEKKCLGKEEALQLIKDKQQGTIVDFVKLKDGFFGIIVEVEVEDEKVKFHKFNISIKGTYQMCPTKKDLQEKIKLNEYVAVTLKYSLKRDSIYAYYLNDICGVVKDDNENTTLLKKALYNKDVQAIAIGMSGREIILEVKIKNKKVKNTNEIGNNENLKLNFLTIPETISKIVKNGFATEEKCTKVVEYLKENGISENLIKKVLNKYKEYPDALKNKIPQPETFYNDFSGILNKALIYINLNKHIRLVGDKGSGKNKLIETIAWIYNRPLLKLSVSRETDKMDLLGSHTAISSNDKTEIKFKPGIVPIAMQYGCFLNLDEINTANPGLLTLLHSATDWSNSLYVPNYRNIIADKHFCLIATMNEGYNGVTSLNQATVDRFVTLRTNYKQKVSEIIKSQLKDIELEGPNLRMCDLLSEGIKKCVDDGELSEDCITVRGYIVAMEAVSEGLNIRDAFIDNIASNVDDEDERDYIINLIDIL